MAVTALPRACAAAKKARKNRTENGIHQSSLAYDRGMKTRLGLELWQAVLLYIVPPLLIGLAVAWRAVRRATNRPDGNHMQKRKRKSRT